MSPDAFTTAYTLDYVTHHLPPQGQRLLEVGCGQGQLARALLDLGYDVVAVDEDHDAVASARQRGVTAHHAQWPDLNVSGFDAILFTRSLHHIHALRHALDRARSALNPGGSVMVEDFRYSDLDGRTIAWFAGTTRLLLATGVLDRRDEWLTSLSQAGDPVPVWRANHGHDLHTADEIDGVLGEVFEEVERVGCAYFFRYISRAVSTAAQRAKVGEAFAALEESLAHSNQIQPLGQRFLARSG
ncbi:MAG: methyltransferase domain-containing protein [Bacteroidota bacterium]